MKYAHWVTRIGTAAATGLAAAALLAAPAAGATSSARHAAATPQPAVGAASPAGGTGTGGATIVTFAWGGGNADQMQALPWFRQYGLHATYYIPSGLLCSPSRTVNCTTSQYMTLQDVRQIAVGGNEIGGLTVSHLHLKGLPATEAEREICDDRVNLTRWGFTVTDFAYPYAVTTTRAASLAQQCGYNSALGAGQVAGAGTCTQCGLYAETVPPLNPYDIRAPVEVNTSTSYRWTAGTFESIVRAAQAHGGGWIVFLVHDVCQSYCQYGVTGPELRQVLAWVHQRSGPDLKVETVRQVIGGPVRPAVPGPSPSPIPPPGIANATLTDEGTNGYPDCFQPADYGSNTATFSYQPGGGPGGAPAETVHMTSQRSGDAKLLVETDLGECSPEVRPGRAYTIGTQYRSSLPVQFDVYYRNQIGSWVYWTSSPRFAASANWQKASWTTPPAPPAATAISFGMAVGRAGTLSTTGYSLAQAHPFPVKPVVLVLLVLAILAPFLGWRFWHLRERDPAGAAETTRMQGAGPSQRS